MVRREYNIVWGFYDHGDYLAWQPKEKEEFKAILDPQQGFGLRLYLATTLYNKVHCNGQTVAKKSLRVRTVRLDGNRTIRKPFGRPNSLGNLGGHANDILTRQDLWHYFKQQHGVGGH